MRSLVSIKVFLFMTDTRTEPAFLLHFELRKPDKERLKRSIYTLIFLARAPVERDSRNEGNCFGRLQAVISFKLGGHCVL